MVEVKKAYTIAATGREKTDGWDVLIGGEWHDRFKTKREADAVARALAPCAHTVARGVSPCGK